MHLYKRYLSQIRNAKKECELIYIETRYTWDYEHGCLSVDQLRKLDEKRCDKSVAIN